eukprot:SAG31_NODE_1279_length_9036_cov_1.858454_3_plen_234_part_00
MPYVPPHRRRQAEPAARSQARPLLVLDVNNVLLCRRPFDRRAAPGAQFRLRRHCNEFVQFCFDHFSVAVWSCGRRDTLMAELDTIEAMRELRGRLLFVWSQESSTNLWPRHSEVSAQKPLFLKEISKVWAANPGFGARNSVLMDDHAEKFERNPPGSCIVVPSFCEGDEDDDCLALNGELVGWLRCLAQAENTSALVRTSQSVFFPTVHPSPPDCPSTAVTAPEPEPEPEPET